MYVLVSSCWCFATGVGVEWEKRRGWVSVALYVSKLMLGPQLAFAMVCHAIPLPYAKRVSM